MFQAEIGHTKRPSFRKTKQMGGYEEENNKKKERPRLNSELRGYSSKNFKSQAPQCPKDLFFPSNYLPRL